MKKNGNLFRYIVIATAVILIAIFGFATISKMGQGKPITYYEFTQKVVNGDVEYAYGTGTVIRVKVLSGKEGSKTSKDSFLKGQGEDFLVTLPDKEVFITFIQDYNNGTLEGQTQAPETKVEFDYQYAKESFLKTISPYLFPIIIIIICIVALRYATGSANKSMGFGKTKAKVDNKSKTRFSDVAGAKEEKVELAELVDFMKDSRKYTELGARIPKGVLLVGPPGTGKTLLAKAVAGESNCSFFRISGSDFVEMFVGVGASRVRDLFDQAKRNAPSIVFIDEIDAVGRQRGAGLGGGNDEREQTLNQLLVEMDGFEANEGIIVIAATNRPDVLDPALLRPGRFDRQIYVHLPDVNEREEILKVHAKNKVFCDDVTLRDIARITSGFSGADLENLLNEAAILAGRDNRPRITMTDVKEAANKVMMGPQKKSKKISEKDKKITAYHESGHAILEKILPNCDEVQEVSIIPRGMAGGYTMSRPDDDESYMTYGKLNDTIASCMGGRIAEKLIFDDITTGASNDIKQATRLARKMVTEFGMSDKLGFQDLGADGEVFLGRDYQTQTTYSQQTAFVIDQEIERILAYNYERATKILSENIDKLHKLAELLLKKETVYKEEVDAIMNNEDIDKIIESMDEKTQKEKELLEKEKQEKIEKEQQRIKELREKAFLALQREGVSHEEIERFRKENHGNNGVKEEPAKQDNSVEEKRPEAQTVSDNTIQETEQTPETKSENDSQKDTDSGENGAE